MSEWKDIASAPASKGYIDMWPQFYLVNETTVIRYAHDEGEAICLIRARQNFRNATWEPYAWAEIPRPPVSSPASPHPRREG